MRASPICSTEFPLLDVLGPVLVVTALARAYGLASYVTVARTTIEGHKAIWRSASHTPEGARREHRKGLAFAADFVVEAWVRARRGRTSRAEAPGVDDALVELDDPALSADRLSRLQPARALSLIRDALERRTQGLDELD
jgi:hypothetical protein